jgi:hypothetical protein
MVEVEDPHVAGMTEAAITVTKNLKVIQGGKPTPTEETPTDAAAVKAAEVAAFQAGLEQDKAEAKEKKLPAIQALLPNGPLADMFQAIENLPNFAAALAMGRKAEGHTALARVVLGGVLTVMKNKKWFGASTTFEGMVEDHFGLEKTARYDAMTMFEMVLKHNLSADTISALGVAKLTLLCNAAKQYGWDSVTASVRTEKALAMNYRTLKATLTAHKALPSPGRRTSTGCRVYPREGVERCHRGR